MHVLCIEDDAGMQRLLEAILGRAGFTVVPAATGIHGVALALEYPFDLITLDLGLPDLNGIKVIEVLRMKKVTVPILVLSGETDGALQVKALHAGADDFLAKPWQVNELVACTEAIVRRVKEMACSRLQVGQIELYARQRAVYANGNSVFLSERETAALELLMSREGTFVSNEALLERMYGASGWSETSVRDVLSALRKKLGGANGGNHYIETDQGQGYVMRAPGTDQEAA